MSHPFFSLESENTKEMPEEEKDKSLEKARAIAGEGSYERVMDELRIGGLLEENVKHIRKEYGAHFEGGELEMQEKDWEMLTLLWLFDAGTLEHSIRTFGLAKKMMMSTVAIPGGETIVLKDLLVREGVSSDQFLRAALFHDIGKIIIPREILLDSRSDEDLAPFVFPDKDFHAKNGNSEKKAALRELYEKGFRPIDLAPLNVLFSEGKGAEILHDLELRGFSEMATMREVLQRHEPESERILRLEGRTLEGELAGHHHNYKREKTPYVMNVSTLRMSAETIGLGMADLIHMADVTDAIRSRRSYKDPLSEMEVLYVIAHEAGNAIDLFTAYVWVNHQYESARSDIKAEEIEFSRYVEDFLEKNEKTFGSTVAPPFSLAA